MADPRLIRHQTLSGGARGTMGRSTRALHEVEFLNSFVEELPGEDSGSNRSRQVPGYSYSRVSPTPVSAPRLLAWSTDLADYLGLDRPAETGPDVEVLAGNRVTASMKP